MTKAPSIELPLAGADGTVELFVSSADELLEGGSYEFRLHVGARTITSLEPSELLILLKSDPTTGHFRPRQTVGTVRFTTGLDDGSTGFVDLDVRPAKLEYETEYRSMLQQISDLAAEAVLQGFAPGSLDAHAGGTGDPELSYRAFAFLVARLRQDQLLTALDRIRFRPHRDWKHVEEHRRLGSGTRTGSSIARQLTRSVGGEPTPSHLAHLPMAVLPRTIETMESESSYDTVPNQFVKLVFGHWQGLALDIGRYLDGPGLGEGPRRRGREEVDWMVEQCEAVLNLPAVRAAGRLRSIPTSNQVLLREPGYREILRTFSLAETTMALDAVLPDDPFSASQRNMATLYEYWCFTALVSAIESMVGSAPLGLLFEAMPGGMSLVLKQGEASKLSWQLEKGGRKLDIDLWFNRTFPQTASDGSPFIGSWARQLRPDASVRIRPRSARPSDAMDPDLDVWIHFDAKYRIGDIAVSETIEGDEVTGAEQRPSRSAKREDLLKMHAYRDAIRRSAGAYVLYPGDGGEQLVSQFHEVLPGIGAFPLRPTASGASGLDQLERFLDEVAANTANQASARERTQYWAARHNTGAGPTMQPTDMLERPPADSPVLLGFVRAEQRAWVAQTNQYNVRVGDRRGAVNFDDAILNARLVVLWTGTSDDIPQVFGVFERTGPWTVATSDDLESTGYPNASGSRTYLVTTVNALPASIDGLVREEAVAEAVAKHVFGQPVASTWASLVGEPA